MKIIRDKNGQITYKGKKLDMYTFCHWLIFYNRVNNKKMTPSIVTCKIIDEYLKNYE